MVKFEGVTVNILVGGQALPEYRDEDSDELSLSSTNWYLQSKAGEAFDLSVKCESSAYKDCTAFVCEYEVDGVQVDKFYHEAKRTKPSLRSGPRGYINGVWHVQQLRFASIHINEDGAAKGQNEEQRKRASSLGLISLRMLRVKNLRRTHESSQGSFRGQLPAAESVSEKALKGQAIDTTARTSEARPIEQHDIYTCDYIDRSSSPFLTFNFKYRSRQALQSMCVIPRSPTPVPLEDRARESLSREELLELLARHEARPDLPSVKTDTKSESRHVKRERDQEFDDILASARPTKMPRVGEVEIVDLLDH